MSQILMRTVGFSLSSRLSCYKYLTTQSANQVADSELGIAPQSEQRGQDDGNKASLEQLLEMERNLETSIPKFFVATHPFHLYTSDVIFHNNIANYKTQGIGMYAARISLAKVYYSIKGTSTRMELFNLVKIPEESCIKARWRIVSSPPTYKVFLSPIGWRSPSRETWLDGISIFHVNNKGLIHCHVCDNIDLDTEDSGSKAKTLKEKLIRQGLNV